MKELFQYMLFVDETIYTNERIYLENFWTTEEALEFGRQMFRDKMFYVKCLGPVI